MWLDAPPAHTAVACVGVASSRRRRRELPRCIRVCLHCRYSMTLLYTTTTPSLTACHRVQAPSAPLHHSDPAMHLQMGLYYRACLSDDESYLMKSRAYMHIHLSANGRGFSLYRSRSFAHASSHLCLSSHWHSSHTRVRHVKSGATHAAVSLVQARACKHATFALFDMPLLPPCLLLLLFVRGWRPPVFSLSVLTCI